MKLLSADEMRELDRRTIEEIGIPGTVLMENAGRGAAQWLLRRFGALYPGPVLVLSGKGNNGGDGYVIARHLIDKGWQVRTVVLSEREAVSGDAALNLEVLRRIGGEILYAADESALESALSGQGDAVLIVDALLGTGLTTAAGGRYAAAIDWINASGRPAMAVDVPSGLDATTGRVPGPAVRAELTVTFGCAKIGLVIHPGIDLAGELVTVDIGIPACIAESTGDNHRLVDSETARRLLPERPFTGHKGTFGHLLVVAGAPGTSGAAAMSAEGGLRSGAGLVTLAAPASIRNVLETKLTEAMTRALAEVDGMISLQALTEIGKLQQGKQALALGPGLGTGEETQTLIRRLVIESPLPMVIDADGLNALAGDPGVLKKRRGPTAVLTPHPGEMARLNGLSIAEIEADRLTAAREFATCYTVVVVLKGARTVIALPDGRVRINGSGNPGLASGGMGDVLTGLIGGLLAQGLSGEDAAVLGVYLHGLAADRLAAVMGNAGLTAGDLLREIPKTRHALGKGGFDHAQS